MNPYEPPTKPSLKPSRQINLLYLAVGVVSILAGLCNLQSGAAAFIATGDTNGMLLILSCWPWMFMGVWYLRQAFDRSSQSETRKDIAPHWEAVHCPDFGWRVRWSEADAIGCWLWVGHYGVDEDGTAADWRQAQHFAERNAEALNQKRKAPGVPWEYQEYTPS